MPWYDSIVTAVLAKWGETATYTPPGGGSTASITVIDDEEYFEMLDVQGSRHVMAVSTPDAEAASVAVEGTLTVGGVAYTIKTVQPDSGGMTLYEVEEP